MYASARLTSPDLASESNDVSISGFKCVVRLLPLEAGLVATNLRRGKEPGHRHNNHSRHMTAHIMPRGFRKIILHDNGRVGPTGDVGTDLQGVPVDLKMSRRCRLRRGC